ncbi:MAG: rhomboid family intramembrane serine protease [Phycisphaerales bacterium]
MLWPLGGLATCRPPHHWKADLITTLGGPAVNLILYPVLSLAVYIATRSAAAVFYNPFDPGSVLAELSTPVNFALVCLWSLHYINLGLLLFNLVPMFPMDGGRILQALVWRKSDHAHSVMVATTTAFVAAGVLATAGMVFGSTTLLAIAAFGAFVSWQERQRHRLLLAEGPLPSVPPIDDDADRRRDQAAADPGQARPHPHQDLRRGHGRPDRPRAPLDQAGEPQGPRKLESASQQPPDAPIAPPGANPRGPGGEPPRRWASTTASTSARPDPPRAPWAAPSPPPTASGWSPSTPGSHRIINAAIFAIGAFSPYLKDVLEQYGHFSTYWGFGKLEVWRLVTFQFLHANFMHVFFNMFGLFIFGSLVEQYLGAKRYLAFYLTCGIFGGLMYLLLNLIGLAHIPLPGALTVNQQTHLIGASAGVFGVILACAYIAPDLTIQLLFPPIPLKMRTFAYAYVVIAIYGLLFGSNAGGDAAHIGGAIAGFFFIRNAHLLSDFFDVFNDSRKPEPARRHKGAKPDEVDRILDKVRQSGIASLTEREKRTLTDATRAGRG